MQFNVFWNVVPCMLAAIYRRFGGVSTHRRRNLENHIITVRSFN
jgi:hypothetical protein